MHMLYSVMKVYRFHQSLAVFLPCLNRLITLSEDLLLKTLKVDSIAKITVLNLHGNGITKLKYLHNIPQLKKLTLSFNEIIRIDELAHMVSFM